MMLFDRVMMSLMRESAVQLIEYAKTIPPHQSGPQLVAMLEREIELIDEDMSKTVH